MEEFKYYNPKTKSGITEAEYSKLSVEEQNKCKPWRKPGTKKQDSKWYVVTPAIAKDVGSIAYSMFPGVRENMLATHWNVNTSKWDAVTNDSLQSTPGVLVLQTLAMIGDATTSTSALNVSSKALYTWVRHQNSGHTNYEAQDLTLYLIAMDQIYTAMAQAARMLGMCVTYSMVNRNIPTLLADAQGISVKLTNKNIANTRAKFNELVARINSLCVPKKFTLFLRHWFIANNVFTDSTSARSQFYLYNVFGFGAYSPKTSTTGGEIILHDWKEEISGSTPIAVMDFLEWIEDTLLEPIIGDEDINVMSGDILKAYGKENLYYLDEFDEKQTVSIVFNEDVLQQIENSSTFRGVDTTTQIASGTTAMYSQASVPDDQDGFITCSLVSKTLATISGFGSDNFIYFNSHKDEITPENNLEWIRDVCLTGTFDTEIVCAYKIVTYQYTTVENTDAQNVVSFTFGSFKNITVAAGTTTADAFNFISLISMFDWHPIIYLYSFTGSSSTVKYSFKGIIGDLKKYCLLSVANVKSIHDACLLGAFNALSMTAQ